MLNAAILSVLASIAAGVYIRAWAFLCFTVVIAMTAGVILSDGSVSGVIFTLMGFLAIMQIGYVVGAFLAEFARRHQRRTETKPIGESSAQQAQQRNGR